MMFSLSSNYVVEAHFTFMTVLKTMGILNCKLRYS